jgi:hypothetical protein
MKHVQQIWCCFLFLGGFIATKMSSVAPQPFLTEGHHLSEMINSKKCGTAILVKKCGTVCAKKARCAACLQRNSVNSTVLCSQFITSLCTTLCTSWHIQQKSLKWMPGIVTRFSALMNIEVLNSLARKRGRNITLHRQLRLTFGEM